MCFSRVSLSIALSHLPKHILQHQASYTKLGTSIREFYLASISWRRTFHGYYSPFFGGYSSKSYQINISLIHSEELLFGLWSVESMTISPCNNLLQFCDDFSMVGRQEKICWHLAFIHSFNSSSCRYNSSLTLSREYILCSEANAEIFDHKLLATSIGLYPRWGVIKLLESTIYLITVPFYFLNLYEEWAINNFTESITL